NGKRVGIWNTYKENGRVIERYDYDNNIQLEPIISIVIPYPDIARENGIQGTVRIRYHINNDCSIDNITIIQSLSPECDQAAIDAMKILSDLSKKYSKKCVDTTIENDFKFKLY
ncbi:MAG TPA: energy transducer TonB, partial [Bacteroidales bacterium]|nr:energy transducer TonB [Bacteroidales bacterium]